MTHAPKSKRRSRAAMGLALATSVLATPALVHAAAATPPEGPSLGPLIALFLFVLALIPIALWLLKRIQPTPLQSGVGLKIVTQLSLGPRERVVVLEAGERWLLLGVTAASIQRIGTLPKGELPAEMTSFKSVLQRIKP